MAEDILYHGEPNGPSLSVLAALAESGLDIECRHIDLLKGARHTLHDAQETLASDMAVEGEGPILLKDGETMSEAVFLAQYFDEAAGSCGLQPKDAYLHWEMMMWCRQVNERLSPAVAYLGNLACSQAPIAALAEEEFAAITRSIFSDDLRQRWQDLRDDVVDAARREDSEAKVRQFVQRVEDKLADGRVWLMGDFSIADLETFAWLRPMTELEADAFTSAPLCRSWMDRLEQRPCVQSALAKAVTENPKRAFAPGPEINRWG
ncbi:glutathione S-transferase family protein [Altericroceibacterium endophyticum]|uniref:Glutathione S-transferase family protein n=1 Tax=Altericroceibacterium endophyticum TaxID=1808508 RepID=A0A6I4T643_9SPHN|nr:glutathione binding-like protein [Altericroceibacterium endophyticum]MXO65390.1 glutathione S-transferase family protein [Altericroceibacterium endophyticum]